MQNVVSCVSFCTDKATNPLNKETDWDTIKGFCDQLNDEAEGWDDEDTTHHKGNKMQNKITRFQSSYSSVEDML